MLITLVKVHAFVSVIDVFRVKIEKKKNVIFVWNQIQSVKQRYICTTLDCVSSKEISIRKSNQYI